MKKVLYTILSVLSIVYIGFLVLNVIREEGHLQIDLGWFEKIFKTIVNFGGVAIIFAFALVNFAGSPLKTVFFILLILAIVCYVIVLCVPEFFSNLFQKKEAVESAVTVVKTLMKM